MLVSWPVTMRTVAIMLDLFSRIMAMFIGNDDDMLSWLIYMCVRFWLLCDYTFANYGIIGAHHLIFH